MFRPNLCVTFDLTVMLWLKLVTLFMVARGLVTWGTLVRLSRARLNILVMPDCLLVSVTIRFPIIGLVCSMLGSVVT